MAIKISNNAVITDAREGRFANTTYFNSAELVFCVPFSPVQGSSTGFVSGGAPVTSAIQAFSFISPATSTCVGALSAGTYVAAGSSSATNGYVYGGCFPATSRINKFPFASCGVATCIGNLTAGRNSLTGHSSAEHGYASGGGPASVAPGGGGFNTIDRFPFASDTNASCVGILTKGRYDGAGISSTEYGYNAGGSRGGSRECVIDSFAFSSGANATIVGRLRVSTCEGHAGQTSQTHGYTAGGNSTSPATTAIDKFPLAATVGTSVCVGDLAAVTGQAGGVSSITDGYIVGGCNACIQRWPFASDTNATCVGNLSGACSAMTASNQV